MTAVRPPSSLFQRTKYRSVEIIITVLYDSTGIKCGFINGNKRSTSNSTCVCWNSTTKKSNSFWIYTYPRKKNSYFTIPFTSLYLTSWNIRWPRSCRQSAVEHVTKGLLVDVSTIGMSHRYYTIFSICINYMLEYSWLINIWSRDVATL